jgi:hypothetical protein
MPKCHGKQCSTMYCFRYTSDPQHTKCHQCHTRQCTAPGCNGKTAKSYFELCDECDKFYHHQRQLRIYTPFGQKKRGRRMCSVSPVYTIGEVMKRAFEANRPPSYDAAMCHSHVLIDVRRVPPPMYEKNIYSVLEI